MEVKPGYKQTEAGVIPEEWAVVPFQEAAHLITCGLAATPTYVSESVGKPFLSAQNVRNGRVVFDNHKFIGRGLFEQITRHNKPRRGDLLYTRVGAGIGEAGIVESDVEFGIYVSLTLIKTDSRKLHNGFASYLLNSPRYRTLAKSGQFAGGGVQNLNVEVVRRFSIPLPSVREQRAIAEALSDVDALLGKLDRLIAKKRDLKQAAMQQLLTGQIRLPGFHDEWEVKRLEEVGEISSAGVDKKIRPGEVPVRLVNYLDVYRRDFIYSDDLNHGVTAPPPQAKRCSVQKGDVFFTPTSETRADIGIAAVAMEDIPDATYSYHIVRLRLWEEWDLRFRTYAFKTRAFLDQAETLCDGNGTRYVISQGKFRSMTVHVPPVPEQTAIAAVLSDMDAELAALEQRLAKTRALKQGMMQELLTGRIRLV